MTTRSSRVCGQRASGCRYHTSATEEDVKQNASKKANRLIVAASFVFVLLFLSECYDSLSVAFKLASLLLTFGCFLNTAWGDRIARSSGFYLLLVGLFLFVQFIYTGLTYQQGFLQFCAASYYYLYCLLLPVFAFIFKIIGVKETLMKLEKVVLLIAVFMLLAGCLYFLFNLNITEINRLRNGLLRINAPFILQIGCIVSAYFFACDRESKIFHGITCLLSFFTILFVYQSRLAVLLMVIAFLFILALRHRENAGAALTGVFLSVLILLLLFTIGPLGEVLESFSVASESGGNTLTRIYEVEYYLRLFGLHPLNGVGLVPYDSGLYAVLSGPFGNYFIDDVGVIGALAEIGLWIIPIYVVPMIVLMVRAFSKEHVRLRILLLVIFLYLVGTTFTTLIVFPYCDPSWSLCLALFGCKGDLGVASSYRPT